MAPLQIPTAGSKSPVTSIASGNNSQNILNANCETDLDGSGVALKVRKPYTISKQREKWTEKEHQKFIEALKLYGRAWRQIEEYIGTKTAVQIRSHAQKFFSKVTKESASSAEAPTEAIDIPPPRPKRKPLHPYPRKFVEAPNKTIQGPSLKENGLSTISKSLEGGALSPTSVLSPEVAHMSTSHAKAQGSGSVSATSSGSHSSGVLEKSNPIKNNSTPIKEKDLLRTLNFSGPSSHDSTSVQTRKEFKDIVLTKDEDVYSEAETKFFGGVSPLKAIKLFGQTVVVTKPSDLSLGMENVVMPTATRGLLMCCVSHMDSLVGSQPYDSSPELSLRLDGQLVTGCILMGERSREKGGSKGFSVNGSNNDAISKAYNAETNQDSVDSKIRSSEGPILSPSEGRKGFVPYKRCVSEREAVLQMNKADCRVCL
uniref:Uncharacterized protein n=1 Tax=Kalanchoe fedtschenkoi TaxID=63787 RepID=A0A7N0V741_KALFE